jgi:hypothetical protein
LGAEWFTAEARVYGPRQSVRVGLGHGEKPSDGGRKIMLRDGGSELAVGQGVAGAVGI